MIKCVAIDDEPPALELVKGYIEKTEDLELLGVFNDPIEGLQFVQKEQVPVLFLDINMPGLNGMQVSRLVPENTKVIFTSAYQEYALESYRVDALDYLLKPFSYEEFLEAVKKAKDYFSLKSDDSLEEDYMFIKADYKLHKVFFENILYIENIKDYIRLHFKDGGKLMPLMSLKSMEEILPKNFMKVHRSFIVNLDAVEMVERKRILFGKNSVPIADRYKDQFNQFLEERSV